MTKEADNLLLGTSPMSLSEKGSVQGMNKAMTDRFLWFCDKKGKAVTDQAGFPWKRGSSIPTICTEGDSAGGNSSMTISRSSAPRECGIFWHSCLYCDECPHGHCEEGMEREKRYTTQHLLLESYFIHSMGMDALSVAKMLNN